MTVRIKKQSSGAKKNITENELALVYMKTLVDTAREPILILDASLRVLSANPIFYKNFHVKSDETLSRFIYDLGNKQWNIPALRKFLEDILPKKKSVKDFEVTHKFQDIGNRTILLNAQQVDSARLIILAMEDITDRKKLEQQLADNIKTLAQKVEVRTEELTARVNELEKLNSSMVGREIKMVQLKEEIKTLKKILRNRK